MLSVKSALGEDADAVSCRPNVVSRSKAPIRTLLKKRHVMGAGVCSHYYKAFSAAEGPDAAQHRDERPWVGVPHLRGARLQRLLAVTNALPTG